MGVIYTMKCSKNLLISCIILLSIGLIMGLILQKKSVKPVFSSSETIKILIDAGHGSPDGGAVGTAGTIEKDINLSIAQKLGDILSANGFIVEYTRTGDEGLQDESAKTIRDMKLSDMKKRRELMGNSKADLFISIHMNSFTNHSAKGLHIFYSAQHEEIIKPLAENIQDHIAEITGAQAHTVKTVSEKLFLMKDPPLPCILAECGFLSNPEEEKLLSQEEYQSKIAWAIAEAIEEFYS